MKFLALIIAIILLVGMLPATLAIERQVAVASNVASNEKSSISWTKENVETVRERLKESSFREGIKQEIAKCKDSENAQCLLIKDSVQKLVKNVLLRVCSRNENVFVNFENRIDNIKKIGNEEKTALKETLQNQKVKLEDICLRVENADEEEIKEITEEIRQTMTESHFKFRIAKRLVVLNRIGLIVQRAEHLETNLNNLIEKYGEDCETEELESLKEQFNSQIDETKLIYEESRTLWEQFKETVENKEPDTEILRQANAQNQLAQLKLKEAHTTIKEIIIELRSCQGEVQETEEPGAEEEEEPE